MQAVMSVRSLRIMKYLSISTRQSSFLISRLLTQSGLLPRTVRIWASDKECFEDSYAWAAAVQKVDDNIHWNHCCQERVKEHNVCNPCVCGHVQLQDCPMQAVTKPSLRMRCAQRERSGQAMTVIHKVLDAFSSSSQMQMAVVARLRQGLALSTTDCSSTSGCSGTRTLGHHCTRTGMQNFLQCHCNVTLCTVPPIRHYTTTSHGIPPVLLSQTQKCPALQQPILWGTSTKSLTQQYSKDGCREMLQAKRVKVLPLLRGYSSGRDTVEKKLLQLMDMWEVEDAVALLRASVQRGVVPHPNVVLNLQQQLANLGEVECLMELHLFLKEHNLTSDARFFHCLQEAYYNSGRISEGVAVLRLLYHRSRKFSDVEIYFTLLTIMVLRHFPDRIDLILSFVTDLKDEEVPVLEPQASLWKCYMITERWSEADDLLLSNEELRPLLPQQVTRICQGVDRAQFDRVVVLGRLLDLPFIRQRLQVLVAETLVTELSSQKQWLRLMKSLKRMKSMNLPLRKSKFSSVLDDLQRNLTPQYDEQIQELRVWLDSFQNDDKQ